MGIHSLAKLIGDHAANAIKENEIKNFFGRKIAIDVSNISLKNTKLILKQNKSL
jgi:hypothetical protein